MNQRAIKDITNFIFMQDAPAKSDIIFIPGTARSTIAEKAAELYHAGYADLVMPSGMYSTKNGRFASENIDNPRYIGEYETEYVYFKHVLMENGVPESAILCEDRATNSMENAAFSAAVLKEAGIKVNRAILCCQAFHARRAFLSYACHFPDVEILVVPTDTQGITRDSWYMQGRSYCKVMAEVAKCGKYFGEFGMWGRYMSEKITLCGDNCMKCPRYNAHTEEELRAVAELWYRVGWRDRIVSNEEIACTGCSSHKGCTYRLVECTKEHQVKKCNQCAEFPCENIQDMLSRSSEYQEKCREVCSETEYAMLKQAFFEKEKNLMK